MKVKALIAVSKDDKRYDAGMIFDVDEKEAQNLASAGAVKLLEEQVITSLTTNELAKALFDHFDEFTEQDFRKNTHIPKVESANRVLGRDDIDSKAIETAIPAFEQLLEENTMGKEMASEDEG